MEDDYKSRIEVNINMVGAGRLEIDDQKALLIDRKKQNADLYTELDTQKDILNSRHAEIARLQSDNCQQQDLNAQLSSQCAHLDNELENLKERNFRDNDDINKIGYNNSLKEKESQDLTAQTRTLEYDISKQLARIDDLNKMVDTKTYELKNGEA